MIVLDPLPGREVVVNDRGAEMGEQLLLQTKPTVISGNAYAHVCCSTVYSTPA
jgi:hypothetical protein